MSDNPTSTANMILPQGGKQAWTLIMQGQAVSDEINTGSPVVMAVARYDDGTMVAGGVYKGTDPTDFNIKFMWVFDANGNQYPGWAIDVSDDEDFLQTGYGFDLPNGNSYQLNIVEND
jgi:hypothetical protein